MKIKVLNGTVMGNPNRSSLGCFFNCTCLRQQNGGGIFIVRDSFPWYYLAVVSIRTKLALGLILTTIPVFSAFSGWWLCNYVRHHNSIVLANWLTYRDSKLGIAFQYPADWKVVKDSEEILLASPPDQSSRLWDGEFGYYDYGIRIMPLHPRYPVFPVEITKQDITEGFKRIKSSFPYKSETIVVEDGSHVSLFYDTANNGRSILALKVFEERVFQIEMGGNFTGQSSLSDLVGFFGIVGSLQISTGLESKAPHK